MIKKLFTISAIILIANLFAQQVGEFPTTVTWTNSDGSQSIEVAVYVPSTYSASNSYSLVIGFPGQGDTGSGHLNRSNSLKEWADDPSTYGNLIVASPSLGMYPSNIWDENYGIIQAIRDLLSATYSIDHGKVFSQGFSYGGKAAYMYGLDEADIVAGIISYSPAFYGDEDLLGTCSSANCTAHHRDFAYSNSSQVYVCTSSGGGAGFPNVAVTVMGDFPQAPGNPSEFYMTPLASEDQAGATGDDSFFLLAFHAQEMINNNAADHGVMYPSSNTSHTMPALNISSQCWDFVQQGITTNIKEEFVDNSTFNIYPNPASTYVQVKSKKLKGESIQILDITGKYINCYYERSEESVTINISSLQNGVYFIKKGTQVKKFIKE